MPIRAENKDRYPPNWPEISAQIRRRAGNKCEQCGVPNYEIGGRTRDGKWHRAWPVGEKLTHIEWPKPGSYWWCEGAPFQLRIIRIVLTVAHLNHDPADCDPANLRCWCQRCHLHYDREHHAATRRKTLDKKTGQGTLFDTEKAPPK